MLNNLHPMYDTAMEETLDMKTQMRKANVKNKEE